MKKMFLGFLAVALTSLFVVSCTKDTLSPSEESAMLMTTSEDASDASAITQASEDQVDMDVEGAGGGGTSRCATVTFSAPRGTFPQTVTIDFGTGCMDRNGRTRKGKVIVTYSDTLTNVNATKTVTFNNYFVDSTKIEGTRVWKNNGLNAQGQPSFTVTATNMKLTFGDGTTATWNANHTVVKTIGFNTRLVADDVWTVSGSETGVNRKGKSFSIAITTPIVHRAVCPWPISGVRSVTVEDKTRSLDYSYGGGDCDNQAQLTLANGDTRVIRLRR